MIQLTLTLKVTTAGVVEASVTVNNSPIQDYDHPDDYASPTYEMTPGVQIFHTSVPVTRDRENKFVNILMGFPNNNPRNNSGTHLAPVPFSFLK